VFFSCGIPLFLKYYITAKKELLSLAGKQLKSDTNAPRCAHTRLILFQMTYFLRKIFTIPFEQVSWLAALCALHLLAQMGNGKLLTLPAYSDRIAWDFSPNSLLPSSQKKHSKSYSVVLSQIGISIPVNAGFVKEIAAFLQFFRFKQYPTICGYSHTTWNR
jgi:hypothetical protein